MAERPSVRVGLLGLGNVGSGVARILARKADLYSRELGCPLELARVLVRDPQKERDFPVDASLLTTDAAEILEDPGIAVVIEVMGGEEPAHQYLREALAAGKYVVTANKEVMAKFGSELLALARDRQVDILYEASVGGGIPIIAPLKRDLLANDIVSLRAIINGTTNYILTAMSRGRSYDEVLAQAQELGYAEPDPSNDVEGTDAAYKLAILASLAFHGEVRPEQVHREGITRLTVADFQYARKLGYTIKLLALAERYPDGRGVQVRVHPAMLPEDEPLAKVDGVLNAVQVEGDLLGKALFQGAGAGSLPTTSAVVADLLDAAYSVVSGVRERFAWRREANVRIVPMGELRTRYYVRMTVADKPGVLAQIAQVLGEAEISVASVQQPEADADARAAEIVLITHEAREASMQGALTELERLPAVSEIGMFLRIEG
jgi:homoserine dehydrogenase